MAAGTLLVEEAGGRISDMKGSRHTVTESDHLLADNSALHDEVLKIFQEIFGASFRVRMPSIR